MFSIASRKNDIRASKCKVAVYQPVEELTVSPTRQRYTDKPGQTTGEQAADMRRVGNSAELQQLKNACHADQQPGQHHHQDAWRQPIGRSRRQTLEDPAMPEQAVEHTGQAAEQRWASMQVLGEIGCEAKQQGKPQEHHGTLARLDPPT